VTPLFRMPDPETAWRQATMNEIMNALCVAQRHHHPPQRDGFRGNDVRERPPEHQRATAVDELGQLARAQDEASARPAQGLVRGRGHDVRVRHGVVVAREHLSRHESGEVRHVDHERRADLVGNLAHHAEVHEPRVRAVSGDEQQRLNKVTERPASSGASPRC